MKNLNIIILAACLFNSYPFLSAQTINFCQSQPTVFIKPFPYSTAAYHDFMLTIEISEPPVQQDVVLNILVDAAYENNHGATSPHDFTIEKAQITFPVGDGGAPQQIPIRIYRSDANAAPGTASFVLKLEKVSGTAAMGDASSMVFTIADNAADLNMEVLQFKGDPKNDVVALDWKITTEKNLAYTIIEKSKDGIHFEAIGKMQALHHSASFLPVLYHFEDEQPFVGINYYRLMLVNLDEQYECHAILAVEMENYPAKTIKIQTPIPESPILKILLNKIPESQATLSLVDLNGRVLQAATLGSDVSSYTFDISQLSKGYYSVVLQTRFKREAALFAKL